MPTALVTGGTSGIGAAFARQLAARGDDLVLVARDAARLESTAAELRARVRRRRRGAAAPTSPTASDVLPGRRPPRPTPTRPVDLLVNNAGFGVHHRLTDPDPAPHEHALDVMVARRAASSAARPAGRCASAATARSSTSPRRRAS